MQLGQSLRTLYLLISIIWISSFGIAQNALFIPPTITGSTFNLNVQTGTQNFYPGNPTPTYGINGAFLSPTIIVNKGDNVTLNVINNLPVATTMHWHGLHVAPIHDGGPHQSIAAGTTWSPSFEILNNAGSFWYHPHGEGKTELHVGKGLAGMFIIHDPEELALGLPQTYGVDDIPLIVQTKAFDVLNQIAIATQLDTAVFVNGTLDATVDIPAQVIRFRLLNGSSLRAFNFGFSNGMTFYQIATDGGLIENPIPLTRALLTPGERIEILVDLAALNGQSFSLMSYASEMQNGIYGALAVGTGVDVIMGYDENYLNGSDFQLLQLNVVAPTSTPVTTIPTTLIPYVPYDPIDATVNRVLVLDTIRVLAMDTPNLASGPFGINGDQFDMDVVNIDIPLNSTEIWTLKNNTHIAHPFHIHDILFNIIERNGDPTPITEQGWKDVVVVMPHDSVKFLTKFTDFTDEMVPYMYHCHLLHHEDDGMMGSFLVHDPNAETQELNSGQNEALSVFPNPSSTEWNITIDGLSGEYELIITSITGEDVFLTKGILTGSSISVIVPCESVSKGIYFLKLRTNLEERQLKLERI